ncbi:hypothetical protein ACWD3I_22855 [Streptomyces sp. NPDC002817]|uniref:hypothetical protein n=1 Tax=Streptomyces sp. NPDC088357 TaxID=3154655 RepID=UPI0034402817
MSCVVTYVPRNRDTRRTPVSGRTAQREIRIPLCAAGGVVAVLLVHVVLLTLSARSEAFAEGGWTLSAAGRLRPYGASVAEWGAASGHAAAQALTWIVAFAPVPLAVLILLWLARRDQGLYVRLATALLLSGASGLGVFAAVRGWPVRETSLIRDYLALPGIHAGWYVLMAWAVATATTKIWPRAGVMLIALSAVAAAVSTTDRPVLAALPAAVGPLLAWYATGRLPGREERQPRGAVDGSRAVTRHGVAAERVPLRQAG